MCILAIKEDHPFVTGTFRRITTKEIFYVDTITIFLDVHFDRAFVAKVFFNNSVAVTGQFLDTFYQYLKIDWLR